MSQTEKSNLVCPWWLCYSFDNPVRRLFHNPETILRPYIKNGQTAIDVGPGMGYFTSAIAKLVGPQGHVTAVDIQQKMLSAVSRRAEKNGVSDRVTCHLATKDSLLLRTKADFVLAFWMVHEVPDQQKFLTEIFNALNPNGLFLLVEPKMHVRAKDFSTTLDLAQNIGFSLKETPEIRLSRSALLLRT
jgi:ubiquinone/menaquinone biosynthesis C-methylase UbiE